MLKKIKRKRRKKKLNIQLPYGPAFLFLGIYPNEIKTYVHTYKFYVNIYSGFICNLQKLEPTFNRRLDKEIVTYACNEILVSGKWEETTDIC